MPETLEGFLHMPSFPIFLDLVESDFTVGSAVVTCEGLIAAVTEDSGLYVIVEWDVATKQCWFGNPIMGVYRVGADDTLDAVTYAGWDDMLEARLQGYVFLAFPAAAELEEGFQGTVPEKKEKWAAIKADATQQPLAMQMELIEGKLEVSELLLVSLLDTLERYQLDRAASTDQTVLKQRAKDGEYVACEYYI